MSGDADQYSMINYSPIDNLLSNDATELLEDSDAQTMSLSGIDQTPRAVNPTGFHYPGFGKHMLTLWLAHQFLYHQSNLGVPFMDPVSVSLQRNVLLLTQVM